MVIQKYKKDKAYKKWKPSEEKKLIQLWKDRKTFPEIGEILRRPSVGVYQRWCIINNRKKLKRNPYSESSIIQYKVWSNDEEDKLRKFVSEGLSNYEISKLMNRSQWSIKGKVKKLCLRQDNGQVVTNVKRGRGRPRKCSKEVTQEINKELTDLLQEIIDLHKKKQLSKSTLNKLSYGYICAIKELMESEWKLQ